LDKLNKKLHPSRRVLLLLLATGFVGSLAMGQTPVAKTGQTDRTVLPLAAPPFTGVIGKTYKESKEAWPPLPTAPAGAPNIVVILLDDVGFGQTGTFGGPVPTPELDKLAAQGLKYTRFHDTGICGPSRAALLTGRNHHNAATGFLAAAARARSSSTSSTCCRPFSRPLASPRPVRRWRHSEAHGRRLFHVHLHRSQRQACSPKAVL
jgi:Sulfatase